MRHNRRQRLHRKDSPHPLHTHTYVRGLRSLVSRTGTSDPRPHGLTQGLSLEETRNNRIPVAFAASFLDDFQHDRELVAVLEQARDRSIWIEDPRLIQRKRRHQRVEANLTDIKLHRRYSSVVTTGTRKHRRFDKKLMVWALRVGGGKQASVRKRGGERVEVERKTQTVDHAKQKKFTRKRQASVTRVERQEARTKGRRPLAEMTFIILKYKRRVSRHNTHEGYQQPSFGSGQTTGGRQRYSSWPPASAATDAMPIRCEKPTQSVAAYVRPPLLRSLPHPPLPNPLRRQKLVQERQQKRGHEGTFLRCVMAPRGEETCPERMSLTLSPPRYLAYTSRCSGERATHTTICSRTKTANQIPTELTTQTPTHRVRSRFVR